MQYTRMSPAERDTLLHQLAAMPRYLEEAFAGLPDDAARAPQAEGGFTPIEQIWHLAELELEGFGERIARLRREAKPHLADFDGDAIAKARDYRSRSVRKGLLAFAQAREQNLATLRSLHGADWLRAGTQEGVGPVSLCDLPGFMLQHDVAHRAEIEDWRTRHAP